MAKASASKSAPKKAAAKSAPKKAAPKKSAPKSADKSAKAKFKNGELVEFQDSRTLRGIYQDGSVYINGVAHTPSASSLKRVDPKKLSEAEKTQSDQEQKKDSTFREIGVPDQRRGENIHEDNPDLHMSIQQEKVRQTVSQKQNAHGNTLYGEAAVEAERKRSQAGAEGSEE